MQPEEWAEILQRLRSARGHLEAVIGMVEREDSCELILHQLGAVQAALRATSTRLLDCQIRQSEEIILDDACIDERSTELTRLRYLYGFVSQYQSNTSEKRSL